jgi:hypothetical protein
MSQKIKCLLTTNIHSGWLHTNVIVEMHYLTLFLKQKQNYMVQQSNNIPYFIETCGGVQLYKHSMQLTSSGITTPIKDLKEEKKKTMLCHRVTGGSI